MEGSDTSSIIGLKWTGAEKGVRGEGTRPSEVLSAAGIAGSGGDLSGADAVSCSGAHISSIVSTVSDAPQSSLHLSSCIGEL